VTEQQIQTNIIKLVKKQYNGYVVNGNYSTAGIPDLICCIDGKFIGIEVKKPGEQPRELQYHHIDLIVKSGGYAFYTTSVDDCKLKLDSLFNKQIEI